MPEDAPYLLLLNSLFFLTTILFGVTAFFLWRRIIRLKKKISYFRSQIDEKTKALIKTNNPLKFLKPYESESSKSIILSIDTHHNITYVNDYAEEFFGFSREELIGHNVFQTIYAEGFAKESDQKNIVDQILAYPRLYLENETEATRKNGEKIWISWTNRIVYDEKGKPKEIRSVGFDITKRKQLEYQLRSLSVYDSLTGVYNRQSFLQFGIKEIKRANRYNRQMSLLILRFDFFHTLDSSHEFSDEILKDIIDVCIKSVRDSDIIGRLNDIEFGILLPETPIEKAVFLAEQLKTKIQERNLNINNDFFINALFGVAEKTKNATFDNLLTKAFAALEKSEKELSAKQKRKGAKNERIDFKK